MSLSTNETLALFESQRSGISIRTFHNERELVEVLLYSAHPNPRGEMPDTPENQIAWLRSLAEKTIPEVIMQIEKDWAVNKGEEETEL